MIDFETNLKRSSAVFEKLFKDKLESILGGRIEIVEGVTTYDMASRLDMLAGIDLWHYDEHGIYGIASRIQFGKCYGTFTIRKEVESGAKTEYEKRKYAIQYGLLYPKLTFQGYVEGDVIQGFAIARTKDIIWMIDHGYCYVSHTGADQKGQASFYVVKWHDIKEKGRGIYVYER